MMSLVAMETTSRGHCTWMHESNSFDDFGVVRLIHQAGYIPKITVLVCLCILSLYSSVHMHGAPTLTNFSD